MRRILTTSLVLIAYSTSLLAQQEGDRNIGATKVIPVSPNAASLGKFGEVPVSYFTGLPNISIPFFSFGTNEMKSSLALSYHAAGMKVSEVPSWTGAGWSVNAGGAISRTIRGYADELGQGFFDQVMKLKFLYEHQDDPAYKSQIRYKLIDAGNGQYDTEPDIFYFNFDNYSGKFYFNQETGKFYTITQSNLVVNYRPDLEGFTIQTENGSTYYFTQEEYTLARTYCTAGGPDMPSYGISSWYLEKVVNKTATDSIIYEYNNTATSTFRTPNSETSYLQTAADGTGYYGTFPAPVDQQCYSEISIDSKKLSKISFKEGHILFTSITSRCDLIGEKVLDKVELYDYSGVLKKRFVLSYGYFGGPGLPAVCNDMEQAEKVKLKLKSIQEETVQGGVTIQNKPYVFDYEYEFDNFPNLRSYQQDFWGYYNGAVANGSFMPQIMMAGSQQIWISGSNRMPNASYTNYGALKRMTYPTGGYTDFLFENNRVWGSYGHPQVETKFARLAGDQIGTQTYYEKEFVIDKPLGGVYIGIAFDFLGCEVNYDDYYDYPGLRCADLQIIGLTPGTVSKDVSPNYTPGVQHNNALYLPNGTYRMMASFIQSGTDFKDFYYEIFWPGELTPAQEQNALAGGLRIKRMSDFDGIDHANDRIRNFEYTSAPDKSSGSFIGPWSNSFESEYAVEYFSHQNSPISITYRRQTRHYLRRTTSGNYPLLTASGSYVGYWKVTVHEGDDDQNGRTVYRYSFDQDDVLPDFPYPYTLKDWTRGNLEMEEISVKSGGELQNTRSSINGYAYSSVGDPVVSKEQLGLKIGFTKATIFDSEDQWENVVGIDSIIQARVPRCLPYRTITGFATLDQTITKEYGGTDSLEKKIVNIYNPANLMPQSMESSTSGGEAIITTMTYPIDYAAEQRPLWMQHLIQKNLVTVPIEKLFLRKKANGTLYVTGGVITTYKANLAAVDEMYVLEINDPVLYSSFTLSSVSGGVLNKDARYKKRISFLEYDITGNIIRQQKADDIELAYLWDYNNSYPIAELTNAPRKDLFYTSFESTEGNSTANDSRTGKLSRTGGYSKALTNLTNGKYILSYWLKTSGNWILQSQEVTVSNNTYNISLTGQVDEVRFYPAQAQLNTYTFDPLVGMTAQCDTKNTITYFEYDSFGRLKTIRDMNKQILKQYDYQYLVPVTQ